MQELLVDKNKFKQKNLHQGLEEFKTDYLPETELAENTRKAYGRDIKGLILFLERRGVRYWYQVGVNHLQAYLASRGRSKSSTLERKAYAIKAFFNFLAQNGYVEKAHPASELIPPKVDRENRRFLNKAEYEALLSQITDPRDKAIVVTFLEAGLRLEELATLTVPALELPRGIIKSFDKAGLVWVMRKDKIEHIPLNWKATQALKVWLRERERIVSSKGLATQAVFLNKFGGPITGRSIQRMVKKYLEQAGIGDASVHSLRHTMATYYLAKGGDIRSVQNILGHASLQTTEIYADLAKKVQKKTEQNFAS